MYGCWNRLNCIPWTDWGIGRPGHLSTGKCLLLCGSLDPYEPIQWYTSYFARKNEWAQNGEIWSHRCWYCQNPPCSDPNLTCCQLTQRLNCDQLSFAHMWSSGPRRQNCEAAAPFTNQRICKIHQHIPWIGLGPKSSGNKNGPVACKQNSLSLLTHTGVLLLSCSYITTQWEGYFKLKEKNYLLILYPC